MCKRKIRKLSVTLIEVLIAMTLTLMLLGFLSHLYLQVSLMGKETEKLQKEEFKQNLVEKRLSNLFSKIIPSSNMNPDYFFYTSEPFQLGGKQNLVFTYDAGVDLNQDLSNHILGRLYLDSDQLILSSWSSPNKWEFNPKPVMKKEVLLDHVNEMHFEFYVPPNRDRSHFVKQVKNDEKLEENVWLKSWKQSYHELPAIVRIYLKRKINGEEIQEVFAFQLPKSKLYIMYEN